MHFRKLRFAALVLLGGWMSSPLLAQELTDANFAQWKDYILTKPEDLAWKVAIAWEQNLGQGVLKSIKNDKPILLWVEGGDPQGCV